MTVRGADAIRTDYTTSKMYAREAVELAAHLRCGKGRKARLTRRYKTNEVTTFTVTVVAGDIRTTMTCDQTMRTDGTARIVGHGW